MSQFKKVTEHISVSPQINKDDIDTAAEMGVTLIINNRPDGEEAGQPTNDTLATYAAEKGIKWAHIPITSGQITMEAITSTSYALKAEDKILAYCRSGTRSCNLWGLAQAFEGTDDTASILKKAENAGYDLTGLIPTLEHLYNASK